MRPYCLGMRQGMASTFVLTIIRSPILCEGCEKSFWLWDCDESSALW